MITKNQTKSLYYLDRDSNIDELVERILNVKRGEITVFMKREQDRLQEKDAGTYFTLEDTLKRKDGELENMMRFFRGAVVPYYVRQQMHVWDDRIPSSLIAEATNEIKRRVGFLKYNHEGYVTDEVNSLLTFERVKDFVQFIEMVMEVCFEDEGHIFPDSDYFKKLEKSKGREAAQRQVLAELKEKIKNKYPDREIK